jgi:hypothetical protein
MAAFAIVLPPRDEQRSPSTPPSVPPIPELAPISFEDLMTAGPPIQETDESPALAEEQSSQTEPAVVTVHGRLLGSART